MLLYLFIMLIIIAFNFNYIKKHLYFIIYLLILF